MVHITEEIIRKRSEHNEQQICTLEELSLHQEYIEKIEHIQDWCRGLQILLLQGNLIARIENLQKLKRLQYLNLAINNIEVVENLERCESLEKLDLTLNFIGNLESVTSLKMNIHLHELFLTGNPCAEFTGYRYYLIQKLPQLRSLDGREITRTERLEAAQMFDVSETNILRDQAKYLKLRSEQRARLAGLYKKNVSDNVHWREESEHCPEVRLEMARRYQKTKLEEKQAEDKKLNKPETLFSKDGRPLNVNQPKLNFNLVENPDMLELQLEVYKYLDTELLKVDLNPMYVTINVKGRIFQLVFPEDINVDNSVIQRSSTTGHLLLRMPKSSKVFPASTSIPTTKPITEEATQHERKQRREYLEIGSDKVPELFTVTEPNQENQDHQLDDSGVPPLE
ncbi:touch insensitive larva B [Carabus blaptoides fortunei]